MAKFTHKLLMAGVVNASLGNRRDTGSPSSGRPIRHRSPIRKSGRGKSGKPIKRQWANACYMAAVYHTHEVVRFGYNNLNHSAYMSVADPAWTSLVNVCNISLVCRSTVVK